MSSVLDQVFLRSQDRASLNYARARAAIEDETNRIAQGNGARATRLRKEYKATVIAFLHGIVSPNGKRVKFEDGTEANY